MKMLTQSLHRASKIFVQTLPIWTIFCPFVKHSTGKTDLKILVTQITKSGSRDRRGVQKYNTFEFLAKRSGESFRKLARILAQLSC